LKKEGWKRKKSPSLRPREEEVIASIFRQRDERIKCENLAAK
jgi:hypothetical protein